MFHTGNWLLKSVFEPLKYAKNVFIQTYMDAGTAVIKSLIINAINDTIQKYFIGLEGTFLTSDVSITSLDNGILLFIKSPLNHFINK